MTGSLSKATLTKALGTLGLVVLLALSWLFLLSPRMGQASEINDQVAGVEASNATIQRRVDELKDKADKLGEEVDVAKTVTTAFPPTADLDNLFRQIREAAGRAGLSGNSVSSLTQGVPVVVADPMSGTAAGGAIGLGAGSGAVRLATMPFSVNATGSHAQLVRFLQELEDMPRAYQIKTAAVAGAATGATSLSLALTGDLYVMTEAVPPTVTADGKVIPPPVAPKPVPAAPAGPPAPAVEEPLS